MPVTTIGNISLPESAPIHHSGQELHQTLKGGIGSDPPGSLIPEWPLPAEGSSGSSFQRILAAVDQQWEERPWIMVAAVAGLGMLLGRLCIRRR